MPHSPPRVFEPLLWLAALVACGLPSLLAYNLPPSATLLNQCVAVAVWGGWVAMLAPRGVWRAPWPLLAALGLVAAAVVVSFGWLVLPASLGWSALGLLAAAALVVVAGADAARRGEAVPIAAAFMAGLLAAGVLSAGVALVQVFAPDWTDGQWLATSGLPGRAVGNLRQPNHLCSLLLWAMVAAAGLCELRWLSHRLLWALTALLVFAVELSASRTGAAGLLLLLLWAALDRRLLPATRWCLAAAPLLYGLAYLAMGWYGEWSDTALGAEARLESGGAGEGGSPNSRLNVWRTAWALTLAQPLAGVGFGEFNFAWSLTAFPGRPTAFFDHTHNLPLQLSSELGLPLAALVLGLLGWALWLAWRRASAAQGTEGVAGRAALVLVLLAAMHSMVEYPLWYAYFLLPTAFAWGLALGLPHGVRAQAHLARPPADRAAPALAGLVAGVLMAVAGALAVADYLRVVVIYSPTDGAGPLAQRIRDGQRSVLFAHHADYAAATNDSPPEVKALAFARAPHSLLDTRLMVAWAEYLQAQGRHDPARWLAARLREFGHPDAAAFFAVCDNGEQQAFQCQLPVRQVDWREFTGRAGLAALQR
jgi:O-antigen ligase